MKHLYLWFLQKQISINKDVEEKVTLADRQDILDVLNYNITDIFACLLYTSRCV